MGRNSSYRQNFRPQNDLVEPETNGAGAGRGGNSYRRDFRPQNGYPDRAGGGSGGTGDSPALSQRGTGNDLPTVKENGVDFNGQITTIEKRLSGVQQDFKEAIQKVSEKENEKFDLIFAILSELQSRQAQLEESVRSLKAQYGNGHMVPNGNQAQQQFGSSGGPGQFGQMNGQMNGQMGGQMNGNMGSQQPMQQFAGVMQADGTQAMFPMTQMMIVQSPTNGNMQYAVPQMMTPTGAVVQQMPAGMMMQCVGQGTGPEMGMNFVAGQETSGSQGQAQMNMRPVNDSNSGTWTPEGGSTMGGMMSKPQEEVLGMMSGGENSSQEGKADEGSPGQVQSSSEVAA